MPTTSKLAIPYNVVTATPDVCRDDKAIADRIELLGTRARVTHTSAALGPSGNFNNETLANWTTGSWSYTPTQTGLCQIIAEFDVQTVAVGYGLGHVVLKRNATQIDLANVLYDVSPSSTRTFVRVAVPAKYLVDSGVAENMTIDVSTFSDSGSWRINSLIWRAVVD